MTDEPNEKSAGQRMYEKVCSPTARLPTWNRLPAKEQKRWEFNATVTPKKQTIKAP